MDKDIRELSDILDSLGVDESAELVSGLNIVNYLGHAEGLQLLAAVMLAALASAFPVGEAQASNKMASMQVSAVVRASAQLQTEYQASHLSVSAEDVARGYVDIAAASRFAVAATKGAAYFIDFHPRSELFQSVTIDGLGGQVELGTEGGTVSQPGAGIRGAPSTLNYRFRLRAGLQPGIYDWPLLLAVRAR